MARWKGVHSRAVLTVNYHLGEVPVQLKLAQKSARTTAQYHGVHILVVGIPSVKTHFYTILKRQNANTLLFFRDYLSVLKLGAFTFDILTPFMRVAFL